MGWNSWDAFGGSITEAEYLENARILAERLLPFGYDTATVDIQWYEPNAQGHDYKPGAPLTMDEYGRLMTPVSKAVPAGNELIAATLFTWWDDRNSGQTVVATTTVTTEPVGRAHREMMTFTNVAPLSYRELADLMEAKLIAMTGSQDAAWIWQGMYGNLASDDIKFAREKFMRVWDWP